MTAGTPVSDFSRTPDADRAAHDEVSDSKSDTTRCVMTADTTRCVMTAGAPVSDFSHLTPPRGATRCRLESTHGS